VGGFGGLGLDFAEFFLDLTAQYFTQVTFTDLIFLKFRRHSHFTERRAIS